MKRSQPSGPAPSGEVDDDVYWCSQNEGNVGCLRLLSKWFLATANNQNAGERRTRAQYLNAAFYKPLPGWTAALLLTVELFPMVTVL